MNRVLFIAFLILGLDYASPASITLITTNLGGQLAEFALPPGFSTASVYPLIVVYHEKGESQADLLGTYTPRDILNTNILNNGWIMCSSAAHGDNWGNQNALNDYVNLLQFAFTNYHILTNLVVAYSGSMGGLPSLLTVGNRTGINTNYAAWIGFYPVINLSAIYTNTGNTYQSSINTAYGSSSYATIPLGHDPSLFAGASFSGLRMLFSASQSDTIAVQAFHTDPMRVNVQPYAFQDLLFQATGPHADASHYDVPTVMSFLQGVLYVPTKPLSVAGNLNFSGSIRTGP
jgi:hypothetical protein